MLCGVCKTREARIFYTEIINGEKKEQYLCEECATKSTSLRLKTPFGGEPFSLGGLLSGLFEEEQEPEPEEKIPAVSEGLTCEKCGMTYDEFKERGSFGCAACYQSFGKVLAKNIKNIQGSDIHVGKRPNGVVEKSEPEPEKGVKLSEVEKLSMQLNQAVECEEYELAASLRDRIRELKNGRGEVSK